MTNHTDTSRSGDLVERLRNLICHGNLSCDTLGDCDEAADRIEALEAEIERLRKALLQIEAQMNDAYNEWSEQGGADGRDAIRTAFRLGGIARAALGEKQ